MINIDKEIVILACKRFFSQVEAAVEAIRDLIKHRCM
jgi:hypothetical protein